MENLVAVDYYNKTGKLIVFVGGYALNEEACTMLAANKIAKQCGQENILVTHYGDELPKIHIRPVTI